MVYSVQIPQFEGPLDLLLQLIEAEKMEITSVSLLQVTEPFVAHVREHQGKIPPEELADFLVVAAKLIYLKSKALLPSLEDASLEEGPDLETQLRMYKTFVEAAQRLGEMALAGQRSYSRTRRPVTELVQGFIAPEGITAGRLQETYEAVIKRLTPIVQLPKAAIERAISIEEKIRDLSERVKRSLHTSFHRFLAEAQDRHEMVVSFLALLELIKQRVVKVEQGDLFHEIQLQSYDS
jgi:segregation and condensation protein A